MSRKQPESSRVVTATSVRSAAVARKLPAARRLLVATIGAATVQFLAGCGKSSVANLMAAPGAPEAGRSGSGQGGRGGQGGSAGYFVANLMAPPFVPQSGTSGGAGAPGHSGSGGESGAAGADPGDMDAGVDDDAGQA